MNTIHKRLGDERAKARHATHIPFEKRGKESNRSHSKMKPCIRATTSTSSTPSTNPRGKFVKKGTLHA
jgi:hypothetical protein